MLILRTSSTPTHLLCFAVVFHCLVYMYISIYYVHHINSLPAVLCSGISLSRIYVCIYIMYINPLCSGISFPRIYMCMHILCTPPTPTHMLCFVVVFLSLVYICGCIYYVHHINPRTGCALLWYFTPSYKCINMYMYITYRHPPVVLCSGNSLPRISISIYFYTTYTHLPVVPCSGISLPPSALPQEGTSSRPKYRSSTSARSLAVVAARCIRELSPPPLSLVTG